MSDLVGNPKDRFSYDVAHMISTFQSYISERTTLVIHSINLVLLLVIPAAVVLYYHPNPGKLSPQFREVVSYSYSMIALEKKKIRN